jgi:hypothetical protein
MLRKLLLRTLTVAITLALMATALVGVGAWRRSEDAQWCRKATTSPSAETAQGSVSDLLEQQRSACATHRQRQRVMFGSVWRTGGEEMAGCGFHLAQLQLLPDHDGRQAILEQFGLDEPGFDPGSREDQNRFIRACSRDDRHGVE